MMIRLTELVLNETVTDASLRYNSLNSVHALMHLHINAFVCAFVDSDTTLHV